MECRRRMMHSIEQVRCYVNQAYQDRPYSTHHLDHVLRVHRLCLDLGRNLPCDLLVVECAALCHDLARYEDATLDHAARSAFAANQLLTQLGWPQTVIEQVCYAISVHSYSKGIIPSTLEAKILQDADRLDALGAIGIIRVVSHDPKNPLYSLEKPFPGPTSTGNTTVEHFFQKILLLPKGMHTKKARAIARARCRFIQTFLNQLREDI